MLQIYNTLTRGKETFIPREECKVGIYACGITVYDYCHIGHARTFVAFDLVQRHFKALGYKVDYIRNITDIDDKIIKRANENNESIEQLTARFIDAMHEDMQSLNLLDASKEPRATHYINNMVSIIQTLEKKGYAYAADNGDVYFNVEKFNEYGKLSNQTLDNLKSGARIEVNEAKHGPLDFVLWKMSKEDEPAWDSPWGKGRPGWHIECSAMALDCLGSGFDIHGGGNDLTFPHHENEIAQSECCTDKTYANNWMHVGFVQVDKEKMSKSLGNFFTIRDVIEKYHPEVVRYFLISGHYRKPINYSEENLDSAKNSLDRIYTALRGVDLSGYKPTLDYSSVEETSLKQKFISALNDDFNSPEALAVVFEIVKEINVEKENKSQDDNKLMSLAKLLKDVCEVLGILSLDAEEYFKSCNKSTMSHDEIQTLVDARTKAKADKDYAKADDIRKQLEESGVTLEDTAQGTIWKI